MQFDCAGAGQRSIALHGGQSWRDTPALLGPILETFAHTRRIHTRLALLETAAMLPLTTAEEHTRQSLRAALTPADETPQAVAALATGPLPAEVDAFLRSLAHHIPAKGAKS
ncbi:hypothetical protein IV417_03630 [Alphaproteobacteria bacterium KMM 3653]|uniref:Uncharacterized protein n=1 Tax=Harenicola maris TaxID=2841044 RepID=A0AAP2CMT6_9RHOB|nr:hypothetical protein [Harenicola maris]